jgi:hypothetical protein
MISPQVLRWQAQSNIRQDLAEAIYGMVVAPEHRRKLLIQKFQLKQILSRPSKDGGK